MDMYTEMYIFISCWNPGALRLPLMLEKKKTVDYLLNQVMMCFLVLEHSDMNSES